jgi:hypothetical protein
MGPKVVCRDCPFPAWLPSAPPAAAPSPAAQRLVTLAATLAATASSSRPSRPLGRVAHRAPPTATFPAPAEYDLYEAGGRRCLISCNANGQRRPFRFKRQGQLLYETDSNFLSMDGAAAGSGGRDYSPYTHGRHDADKGQLGASIQFDLVPKANGKASVPGRGSLGKQPVTHYYDTGTGLSDGRAAQVDRADHIADHMPDAVEKLLRRHAEAHPVRLDSSGAGPSDLRHCYMCETRDSVKWYYWPPKRVADPQPPHHRVCEACRASLLDGSGASIQLDLVPKAKAKASVPGRGRLRDQPVTHYYIVGC